MRIAVLNTNGQPTGREVELPDSIFNLEQPNDHAIYLAVKHYLGNQRQGTHKSKERGEMSGSTRKLHRQKGTGGSRKGDINNPLYKGGGRVFGPRPRSYRSDLNKKVRLLAKKSALTYKARENSIMVLEDFDFDSPKTKQYINILKNFGLTGRKSLMVLADVRPNVFLSLRNIPKTNIALVNNLNTYSILNSGTLILSESAAKSFTDN